MARRRNSVRHTSDSVGLVFSVIDADLSRTRRGIAEQSHLWTETIYNGKGLETSRMTQLLEIDGKKIFLVGTAHVSEESARLVADIIDREKPDRKTSGRKWTS